MCQSFEHVWCSYTLMTILFYFSQIQEHAMFSLVFFSNLLSSLFHKFNNNYLFSFLFIQTCLLLIIHQHALFSICLLQKLSFCLLQPLFLCLNLNLSNSSIFLPSLDQEAILFSLVCIKSFRFVISLIQ